MGLFCKAGGIMQFKILSLMTVMILVMDPCGNLPTFVALLKDKTPKEYCRIIVREALVALIILVFFLVFGDRILALLHVSKLSLEFGGSIVLFLISIKMIFGMPIMDESKENRKRELFIVPLAVPLFAGPSAIAMTIVLRNQEEFGITAAALVFAWLVSAAILLCGRFFSRILGPAALDAMESLVGFLLTILSAEMFISAFRTLTLIKQ